LFLDLARLKTRVAFRMHIRNCLPRPSQHTYPDISRDGPYSFHNQASETVCDQNQRQIDSTSAPR
jgi:hypothetical protein